MTKVFGEASQGAKNTSLDKYLSASPKNFFLLFLVFLIAGTAVHFSGFRSPMVYDSSAWILGKEHVFARYDPLEVIGLAPGRPLFMLTLYLNYLAGGMDPFLYRLVNSAILALSGLVLTTLATIVLELPGLGVRGTIRQKRLAATFVGLLFVVHPLQSFVVLYIWQRAAIMACLFYFGSLAIYLALRSGRLQQPVAAYILVQVLFLAAMVSKENAATLPFVLILSEITFFRLNIRDLAKRIVTIALITAPPIILYVLALRFLHGTESGTPAGVFTRLIMYYQISGMNPLQVFMTECRVVLSYLWMIVLPGLVEVKLVKATVISTSFWNPPSTPFVVSAVIGLVGLGVATLRRIPILAFGILFYLVTSVPEAFLIPQYLFAGYRPILPMVGVLLILVWAAMGFVSWSQARPGRARFKTVGAVAGVLVVCSLVAQSVVQARNWNPHLFWRETYRHLPELSERVETVPYLDTLLSYSYWLLDSREYDKAIAVLGKAGLARSTLDESAGGSRHTASKFDIVIRKNPDKAARALINLGVALKRSGDPQAALSAYKMAAQVDPKCARAWYNLGHAFDQAEELPKAVKYYQEALKHNPGMAEAWYNRGLVLKRMGDLPEAIRHYEKAVRVDPKMGGAYNNLGLAWEESGDLSRALAYYSMARQLIPNNRELNYNFGNALMKNGNLDEAVKKYRKSLEIDPDFSKANGNLGVALLRLGRFEEAVRSLKKALLGDNENAELHNAAGVALAELGDKRQAIDHFKEALSLDPKNIGARQNMERLTEKSTNPSGPASSTSPSRRENAP